VPPEAGGFTCEADLCTVTGPELADTTLTADKKWLLKGGVFVGNDTDPAASPTTLTIAEDNFALTLCLAQPSPTSP
jgi:hypothetical protein